MPSRTRSGGATWLVWLSALLCLLFVAPGSAQAGTPIPRASKGRVLELVSPVGPGHDFDMNCTLRGVEFEAGDLVWRLRGPERREASIRLGRKTDQDTSDLPSFVRRGDPLPPEFRACEQAFYARLGANDDGNFWADLSRVETEAAEAEAERVKIVEAEAAQRERIRLASLPPDDPGGSWFGDAGDLRISAVRVKDAFLDGAVHLLLLVGLWCAGLALLLRREGSRTALLLLAITVVGGLLRGVLSPQVNMAPWPYSRVVAPARMLLDSPSFLGLWGDPLSVEDTIFTSVFVFSLLTPGAIYMHARYLLADSRRALVAAALVALLPLHLRFSHSDTAFVPSIVTSAIVFAMIHAATREARPGLRILALLLLPMAMVMMFRVRPLNIMYAPLMLATCGLRGWQELDKRWVAVATVVVAGATLAIGVPALLEGYGREVSEGLSVKVLLRSLGVFFSWRYNYLINPMLMPTGITLLAGYGAWLLWRGEERRVGVFLMVWLLLFLVAHAYIVPESPAMQARYHLHLVTPFMMLAACGAAEVPAGARRKLVGLYLLAVPLLHAPFITDTDYNDMHEFRFVQKQAAKMASGCSVLEYAGPLERDARFGRMGAFVDHEGPRNRFELVIRSDENGGDEAQAELAARPAGCAYVYVGLPCEGLKAPDEDLHPVCQSMLGAFEGRLELVERFETPSRPYDGNYAAGYRHGNPANMTLRLYRVRE